MQGKIYEIPLDISSGVLTQQIREVVTEDMGTNTFKFKLVKDKHIPYDLSGTIVRMMVKTPSGARIQQECIIETAVGGVLRITLKQSLLLEHGSYIAELQIYDAITQSIRLTTPTFNYHVRQSLQNSESIVATDEYTILQEALADLAGINIVVANKADKSDVGDLEYLETEGKTNIVAAINEVKSQSNETATDLETHKAMDTNPHPIYAKKQQENWISPTLLNAWTNYSEGFSCSYYKDEFGIVRLRGLIAGGSVGNTAFILPADYRPKIQQSIAGMYRSSTTYGPYYLSIGVSGEVQLFGVIGSNWNSLDGITFRAGV